MKKFVPHIVPSGYKGYVFFFFLLLNIFMSLAGKAQINAYGQVTAISGMTLTLSNVNQTYHTFAVGEPIILIQMQDTVIGSDTVNNSSFGTLSVIANAGNCEVDTITGINSAAGVLTSITINKPPKNNYNTGANARTQIVSFNILSATDYTTSSNLVAVPWDGNIGGILALQAGGTLTLANSLSTDGLGFRGGAFSATYYVNCEPAVYDTTSPNYGFKGEGIYASSTINFMNQTGRSPLVSGGGGGSDGNAGGGGGGNYTSGGVGGIGYFCQALPSGGFGGIPLGGYTSGSRVYMGGGGGGGQQNNGESTPGGTGGGILFLKAKTLTTSCSGTVSISSSGIASQNSGADGAGGGGAGGTVILEVSSFSVSSSCPLLVQANGGNGGNVANITSHGGGGGGGQGSVVFSAIPPAFNVTATTLNGRGGSNSFNQGDASGGNGGSTDNVGILFGSGTVLPIDFISFSAGRNGSESSLIWSIGKTNQQVSFRVQRSGNGVSFQDIGVENASPEQTNTTHYSFTDRNPLAGRNYYRIEETDLSGVKLYSTIATVDFNNQQNTFSIFPNPSDGQFTIRLNESFSQPVSISIDDLAGRTIYRSVCQPSGNLIPVALNKSLARGMYMIHLDGTTNSQTGKLIIR